MPELRLSQSGHIHLRLTTSKKNLSKASLLTVVNFSKRQPLRTMTQSNINSIGNGKSSSSRQPKANGIGKHHFQEENTENTLMSNATTAEDSGSTSTVRRKQGQLCSGPALDLRHIQVESSDADINDNDHFTDIPAAEQVDLLPATASVMWSAPPEPRPSPPPPAQPSPAASRPSQSSRLVLGAPTPETLALIHSQLDDRDGRCRCPRPPPLRPPPPPDSDGGPRTGTGCGRSRSPPRWRTPWRRGGRTGG